MISEEQKKNNKLPIYKQGSKSMGAKLANPDYADPQKIFPTCSASQISLCSQTKTEIQDLIGEPEDLDLSLNENEVLTEFDRRLKITKEISNTQPVNDTGQNSTKESSRLIKNFNINETTLSTSKSDEFPKRHSQIFNSSQSLDSYYECLMEKKLDEACEDDFSENFGSCTVDLSGNLENSGNVSNKIKQRKNTVIKRPIKAPPPIPIKPARLSNNFKSINNSNHLQNVNSNNIDNNLQSVNEYCTIIDNNIKNREFIQKNITEIKTKSSLSNSTTYNFICEKHTSESITQTSTKGWVKTIVGRFE